MLGFCRTNHTASCLAWFLAPRPYLCPLLLRPVGWLLFIPSLLSQAPHSKSQAWLPSSTFWGASLVPIPLQETKTFGIGPLGSCGFRLAVSVLFLIYEKVCFRAWLCLFGFPFVYFSFHCYLCAIKAVDQNIILLYQLEQKSFCIFLFSLLSHHPFLYNLCSSHS